MLIKKIVYLINKVNARLLDVFFTGPTRLYLSQFITNKFLKYYLFIEGIFTILFNGYNYLHFDKKIILPIKILNIYSDIITGKPQIHRLYNLFVMYPLHVYIMLTTNFDKFSLFLFILITFFGFIFNAYNYCSVINLPSGKTTL